MDPALTRKPARSADLRGEAGRAREMLLRANVAARDEAGLPEVAERVARAVAEAEAPGERAAWAERFAAEIVAGRFWPSVPILSNAGRTPAAPLAACFVLAPEDSLDSIYETLRRAACIQQGSGGVGLDLSNLRPRGAPIARSGGVSPGPVAFAELAAHSARVNAMSGRREGAHLIVLADSHPDVLAFVQTARERDALRGAGLALGVSDAFLAAVRRDGEHTLHDPRGRPVGTIPARQLLHAIAVAIRDTGNPTLLFLGAIAAGNPTPHLGAPRASNPCGEQPLLPDESCVLGSLALPAFADARGRIDLDALGASARLAVRFLDDVVTVTGHPDPRCAAAADRTRKIGLGLMGYADLLLRRDEPYGDAASLRTAEQVVARVACDARVASEALAAQRGAYPASGRDGRPRRNASLLAIAPTGTVRLLAGCSGGIEPWIDPVATVRSADGHSHRWADLTLLDWLECRACDPTAVLDALLAGEASEDLPGLRPTDRRLLRRAHEVPAGRQLLVQARFQAHVDGGVSKTVHLPANASATQIVLLIHRARTLGCKGVAFWRYGGEPSPACVRCAA